ncbi:MAG: M64 family metallopeptidase [Ignavibacteriota bacterium]
MTDWQTGATLRMTLYHSGTKHDEHFSVKLPPQGGRLARALSSAIDTTNVGDYQIEVRDSHTSRVLFSRGFDGVLEPDNKWAAEILSVRFPFPSKPVLVAIRARNDDNVGFHDVWTTVVRPDDIEIASIKPLSEDVITLMQNGSPAAKVDIAILGDGYASDERAKFAADAQRATESLFSMAPYRGLRSAFNVRAVFTPSAESGLTDPTYQRYHRSALGMTYNINNTERALGTLDDTLIRDAAAAVPYEVILVLVNSARYGGMGLTNQYATVPIDNPLARYIVVHEFSHEFAGLADEYYFTDQCSKGADRHEPWRPNVTLSATAKDAKWAAMISAPVPSPWQKEPFEKKSVSFVSRYFKVRNGGGPEPEISSVLAQYAKETGELLNNDALFGSPGLFEGADGQPCGAFRPEVNCNMFLLGTDYFCPCMHEGDS